jgi:polyisoprenoid-binding protein YceI
MTLAAFTKAAFASGDETLIVFTNKKLSPVNSVFQEKYLPGIVKSAQDLGVNVRVDDMSKGVPTDVSIAPLIVFQNPLGRSIYQGRTNTLDRIRNFIRTSRRIPQGKADNVLFQTPAMISGRSVVYSPIKISSLGGTRPGGYDEKKYQEECISEILAGLKSYVLKDKILLDRSSRGFYMDFYPWRGEDGTLFVSLALYSQFHCKKPVFELKGENLKGPWDQRERLFRLAGARMEEEVRKRMADPYGGDGFDSVPSGTPIAEWESLGYALPPISKERKNSKAVAIKPPSVWHVPPAASDGEPMIQFHFPAPLDNYAGEFKSSKGEIRFPRNLEFSGMNGHMDAISDSATMGEADLDATIKGPLFLDRSSFPFSRFTLSSAECQDKALAFGQMSIVRIAGNFSLKGKTVPLSLAVEIEPILDDSGNPMLVVQGSFPIDLRLYGIEGATGPSPQKYTVDVELHLTLVPGPD